MYYLIIFDATVCSLLYHFGSFCIVFCVCAFFFFFSFKTNPVYCQFDGIQFRRRKKKKEIMLRFSLSEPLKSQWRTHILQLQMINDPCYIYNLNCAVMLVSAINIGDKVFFYFVCYCCKFCSKIFLFRCFSIERAHNSIVKIQIDRFILQVGHWNNDFCGCFVNIVHWTMRTLWPSFMLRSNFEIQFWIEWKSFFAIKLKYFFQNL